MQISSKVEFDLIQPRLKNQQLTGIATQKSVRTIVTMNNKNAQFAFPLSERQIHLLSVDEIYQAITQELLGKLGEDRRLERKSAGIHTRALGDYFSMLANTVPEGGLIAIGVENDGVLSGCSKLSQDQLNNLERTADVFCPDARYDIRRLQIVRVDGAEDFIILFRVFYCTDKLVRTVGGDAFIRVGESKKRLSTEEAREIEIDKGQVDLEQEPCGFLYPNDFDMDLVRQFSAFYKSN